MVTLLDDRLAFPPVWTAADDGLLAVGADLSVERLTLAYTSGIFPWPIFDDMMTWFAPHPRTIFELANFHVSRSFRRVLKRGEFEITVNRDFSAVIEGCRAPAPGRESTWITKEIVRAYTRLHEAGIAHSVEAWDEQGLAGGLYGVSFQGFFGAESMFSNRTNGSKLALHGLVERMKARGMSLLDAQVHNPHLESLGSVEITRADFMKRLEAALHQEARFLD